MVLQPPSVAPQGPWNGSVNRAATGSVGASQTAPQAGGPAPRRTPAVNGSGVVGVGTDVQKSAENLFEARAIVEIRQVEGNTRKDIEDKKQALRQLVGDSYRDLIASADTIMQMSTNCSSVMGNIQKMQDAFSKLSQTVSAPSVEVAEPEKTSKRKALYSVGSRIKYLVDAPEEIWGCLDTMEYLQAAWRYLRTVEVHRVLTDPSGEYTTTGLLKRFPLLRHQWPTVEKFRRQIVDRVKQRLRAEAHLGVKEASVALAAAASLDILDSEGALGLFLDQRRSCLALHLTNPGSNGADSVAALFEEVAGALQLCVCQVGQLFLRSAVDSAKPLLAEAVYVDDDLAAGELIFEGTRDDSTSTEAAAWAGIVRDIRQRLAPLQPQQVEAAASEWLGRVAQTVEEKSGPLLRECTTPEQLSRVEAEVRNAIKAWDRRSDKDGAHVGRGMRQGTGVGTSHQDALATGTNLQLTWDSVCDWVVGRQLDLWEMVFEAPFLRRGKELINEVFEAIGTTLDLPLDSCLAEAGGSNAEKPGHLESASWPYHLPPQSKSGFLHEASSSQSIKRASSAAMADAQVTQTWRQRVSDLKLDFDQHLKAALQGCLALLADSPSSPGMGFGYDIRRSFSSSTRGNRKRGRVVELEPYIQERCAMAVGSLADSLQSRLSALPEVAAEGRNITVQQIEQILLIGRLAMSLGESSSYIRVILGPPEEWYLLQFGDSRASGYVARHDYLKRGSPQLASLQARLVAIGLSAHSSWAAWAAAALKEELQVALMTDGTLAVPATTKLCTWQEIVLTQDDSISAGGEMRFSLPTFPTAAASVFLLDACRELQRAGGHTVSPSVLQLFEWELGAAVIAVIRSLLSASAGRAPEKAISEKGILQLLLDVRYLRDVLSGGRPASSSTGPQIDAGSRSQGSLGLIDPTVSAALAERKRAMVELESMLQDRLDPIDWATYEPYLWVKEAAYYQRCAVLVGSLSHLHPVHTGAAVKLPAAADTNAMNTTPAVPRFSYLPISQPQTGDKGKALPRTSVLVHASSGSLDESYSFADLGSKSLTGAVTAPSEDASAFADLKSKITSRGAALGSIFTAQAAEVASMASSFGDLGSLSSSSMLSSAFSSFSRR